MKLTYDGYKDHKYIRSLTHIFCQSRKGSVVSGMSMRVWFNQNYGMDIDHHEWAYTLDWMRESTKEADYHSHNGGDTQYLIK